MTDLDVTPIDITGIGFGALHVSCCVAEEEFICGAPYHPESAAPRDTPEEECCQQCVDRCNASVCRAGHFHCPLRKRPICPDR